MKTTQSFQVPQSPSIYARDPVLPFQVPSAIHEAPEHSISGLLQSWVTTTASIFPYLPVLPVILMLLEGIKKEKPQRYLCSFNFVSSDPFCSHFEAVERWYRGRLNPFLNATESSRSKCHQCGGNPGAAGVAQGPGELAGEKLILAAAFGEVAWHSH